MHMYIMIRVRNQGECYSSYLAVGLLTFLLSHRLASRAMPAHHRWPRRMHPSPLPSIILTLPFHSEFQIPQNGIPHSNFLSHPKVEPLAPNTSIKSTTATPQLTFQVLEALAGDLRGNHMSRSDES